MTQKKVLTIQDISCTGRCSITVALPILSACGLHTAILPTSVLSTHTGGFTGYYHRDLTEDMLHVLAHWETLALHFDAIYVGFLANAAQVDNALAVVEAFRAENTLVFVDPAMADEGQLYSLLPKDFPAQMGRLCQVADVIVPNMTEAFLLLGEPYQNGILPPEQVSGILRRLYRKYGAQTVLTGVQEDANAMGAAFCSGQSNAVYTHMCPRQSGVFYGTGDVFAATLLGALLHGFTVEKSVDIACEFVADCIARTVAEQTDRRYGVDFEQGIPLLLQMLNQ